MSENLHLKRDETKKNNEMKYKRKQVVLREDMLQENVCYLRL